MVTFMHNRTSFYTALFLCLTPIIAAVAPRALAFIPGVIGLFAFLSYSLQSRQWLPIHKGYAIIVTGITA